MKVQAAVFATAVLLGAFAGTVRADESSVFDGTRPTFSGGTGGVLGGYLEFNGVSDFATFSSPLFDVGSAGTLSFWTMMDDQNKRNQFFEGPGNGDATADGGASFEFQYRPDKGGQLFLYSNEQLGDDALVIGSTKPPGPGVWFNVQYSWDIHSGLHGEGHIYIDGSEVSYEKKLGPAFKAFTTPIDSKVGIITVGADPDPFYSDRFLDGKLDDVAFYNRVLTQAERDSVRTTGAASAMTGQVAHWAMDDPVGATAAVDSSGNGVNLQLSKSYELHIVSPTTASPVTATAGASVTVAFNLTENGVPLDKHVSVTDLKVSGVPCAGVTVQEVEDFSSFSGGVPDKTLLANDQLIVQIVGNATMNVDEQGRAVLTSPAESDGIIITSVHSLPATYIVKSDVEIIDFGHNLTDLPENGFYWNTIMDAKPIGPTNNEWTHKHRKVAIDIDNHDYGSLEDYGVYILYYYGEGMWDNYFWDGSKWVDDWVPAFTYENDAWYHTEIEKTATDYRIRIKDANGNLMTNEAVIDIASVVGADEDWFYLGEPHTNWYTGTAAVDNLSITAVERDAWYDSTEGHWKVNCTMPSGITGLQDLSLEAQYDTERIVRSALLENGINLELVPEPAAFGMVGLGLLALSRRRK